MQFFLVAFWGQNSILSPKLAVLPVTSASGISGRDWVELISCAISKGYFFIILWEMCVPTSLAIRTAIYICPVTASSMARDLAGPEIGVMSP